MKKILIGLGLTAGILFGSSYHERGLKEFNNNNYKEAYNIFKEGSKHKNPESIYALAVMYQYGTYVKKNEKHSCDLYEIAGHSGITKAETSLGNCYVHIRKRDMKKAHEWFKKAAEKNDPEALYSLGSMYEQGFGVIRNTNKAYNYYIKSANQGYISSEYNLGVYFYERGNYGEAYNWFIKAANKGHDAAQNNLGNMFYKGEGINRNLIQSYQWLRKTAENGVSQASNSLQVLCSQSPWAWK